MSEMTTSSRRLAPKNFPNLSLRQGCSTTSFCSSNLLPVTLYVALDL